MYDVSSAIIDRGDAVAVVGAGPHGMSALKALLAAGIPADGFDRADDVGGNWRFGGPTSRVYESTHLISSKPFTQFPDYPMPDDFPDYPSHRQVLEYFCRYADHFGLRERIRFNTSVIDVRPAPADAGLASTGDCRWDVTIRSEDGAESTLRYDAVVVANGHNWNPKIPQYPGLDTFTGQIVHSADYKSADVLRRRRVLVVGAGNTGCDIAVESAQNASATYHSTRRGYWYNPKYAFGRPSDQVADSLLALRLPLKVRRVMLKTAQRTIVGDYTKFGLRAPDHDFFETHPVVNQQLVYYVGHGDIVPKPDVDHFEQDAVVFTDGTRAEIDVAVFATGYLATFPFLDDTFLDISDGRPRLGLQMAAPGHRNLWVSGLIQPDSGQWTIAHWQGEAIAHYLALARGNAAAAGTIHAELIADRERRFSAGTQYKDSSRHYYEIAHQDYLRALEDLLAQITAAGESSADLSTPVGTSVAGEESPAAPRVMRLWEWSLPPRSEHLEILSAVPDEDTGRPPLLFLHGLGHGAWCYAEHWLGAAAAAGYPAYALSFRGHGGSGGHNRLGRTMLRGYVHDTLQAITQLPTTPVIVGHSLGSLVAQRVLARYPARAGVLLAPLPRSGVRGSLARVAHRKPVALGRALVGGTLTLQAEDLFTGLEPHQGLTYASRIGRESPWVQYAMVTPSAAEPIDVPTLVVGATDDALVTSGDVERTAADTGGELVWVPGGHDMMLDSHWQDALGTILAWLDVHAPAQEAALPGARLIPSLTTALP